MPHTQRTSNKNTRKSTQPNLFNPELSSEANRSISEANINMCEAMEEENSTLTEKGKMAKAGTDAILAATTNLKSDFSSKDVNECAERVSEVEVWISATEDNINSLQASVQKKCPVLDLEARS